MLIIHYHFKKGGVTDVISEAIKTFDSYKMTAHITLACGDTCEKTDEIINSIGTLTNISIERECIDALGYSENFTKIDTDAASPPYNYSTLESFFATYTNSNTLWWVHNHHIGKNPFFTKALMEHLETTGQHCILHMHDFPEQARFSNLKALQKIVPLSSCYKALAGVQYAVINSVDADILRKSGLRAHYIPNIVSQNTPSLVEKEPCNAHAFLQTLAPRYAHTSKNALLFTYPVRCIRRKNALEAALIAKLYESYTHIPCNYNITLPGESEQETRYSRMVQSLFEEHVLHGFFALGKDLHNTLSLAEICEASNLILSSSIQEGFGFSYLGSAAWGSPLLARRIAVAEDSAAILKSWNAYWYNEITIPVSLLSSEELFRLRSAYERKIKDVSSIVGYTLQNMRTLEQELNALMTAMAIDFSFLSATIQVRLIRDFDRHRDDLLQANKILLEKTKTLVLSTQDIKNEKIQRTRQSIKKRFGKIAFIQAFTAAAEATKNERAMHNPHSVALATLKAHAHIASLRTLVSL